MINEDILESIINQVIHKLRHQCVDIIPDMVPSIRNCYLELVHIIDDNQVNQILIEKIKEVTEKHLPPRVRRIIALDPEIFINSIMEVKKEIEQSNEEHQQYFDNLMKNIINN